MDKKKPKNRFIGIQEKADSCQVGGEWGDWVKNVKALRSINWQLKISHGK